MIDVLHPRDVAADIVATCNEVTLDVIVHFATPPTDPASPVQRRIEAMIRLPSQAKQAWWGDVELWFNDGKRLSGLSLYSNFAVAETSSIDVPQDAEPAWLSSSAPGDDCGPVGPSRVTIDRGGHAVRIQYGTRDRVVWFALADGLYIGLDAIGDFAELIVAGVEWTSTDPV